MSRFGRIESLTQQLLKTNRSIVPVQLSVTTTGAGTFRIASPNALRLAILFPVIGTLPESVLCVHQGTVALQTTTNAMTVPLEFTWKDHYTLVQQEWQVEDLVGLSTFFCTEIVFRGG